ncbi:hypothetical protein T479_17840 [Lysinibacillus varians]|nr:hypothetical protein T479_17840 [Lysinibacillus varians]
MYSPETSCKIKKIAPLVDITVIPTSNEANLIWGSKIGVT